MGDRRGSAGVEHGLVVATVALLGLGGFSILGGSLRDAIAGDAHRARIMAVSSQAGASSMAGALEALSRWSETASPQEVFTKWAHALGEAREGGATAVRTSRARLTQNDHVETRLQLIMAQGDMGLLDDVRHNAAALRARLRVVPDLSTRADGLGKLSVALHDAGLRKEARSALNAAHRARKELEPGSIGEALARVSVALAEAATGSIEKATDLTDEMWNLEYRRNTRMGLAKRLVERGKVDRARALASEEIDAAYALGPDDAMAPLRLIGADLVKAGLAKEAQRALVLAVAAVNASSRDLVKPREWVYISEHQARAGDIEAAKETLALIDGWLTRHPGNTNRIVGEIQGGRLAGYAESGARTMAAASHPSAQAVAHTLEASPAFDAVREAIASGAWQAWLPADAAERSKVGAALAEHWEAFADLDAEAVVPLATAAAQVIDLVADPVTAQHFATRMFRGALDEGVVEMVSRTAVPWLQAQASVRGMALPAPRSATRGLLSVGERVTDLRRPLMDANPNVHMRVVEMKQRDVGFLKDAFAETAGRPAVLLIKNVDRYSRQQTAELARLMDNHPRTFVLATASAATNVDPLLRERGRFGSLYQGET